MSFKRSFTREEITIPARSGLLFIEERGKCIVVEQKAKRYYIPRSQISYMQKDPPFNGIIGLTIKIPLWLADEKGLSDR